MAKPSSTPPRVVTKKHIARLERERRQVNLIRTIAVAGIVIVVLLLGYGYLNLNVLQLRKPVAEVNGTAITAGQWQERVRFQRVNLLNLHNTYTLYQQQFGMDTTQQLQEIAFYLDTPETLGQQVLDQMIDEVLIRQEAEKRGITFTDAEVQKEIQDSYGFFPDGTPTPTATPTEFLTPTLSAQQLEIYPATSTQRRQLPPLRQPPIRQIDRLRVPQLLPLPLPHLRLSRIFQRRLPPPIQKRDSRNNIPLHCRNSNPIRSAKKLCDLYTRTSSCAKSYWK